MKTIVIKDADRFCYRLPESDDKVSWSQWDSAKYGKFTIFKLQYVEQDDDEIKCVESDNMCDNEIDVILGVLTSCRDKDCMV